MTNAQEIEVTGKFYPDQSSQCLTVRVTMDGMAQLSACGEDGVTLVQAHISEVKIADKIGSVPREIVVPKVGLLIVESDKQTDAWLANGLSGDKLSRMESSRSFVVAACIGVPAFLYVFFAHLVPVLAILFADMVPDSAVDIASRHTMTIMDSQMLEPSQIDEMKRLSILEQLNEVVSQIEAETTSFNIQFRASDAIGANAFALPDGTIVFTDEFVELVEGDIDLMIAVLLHEIGHVEHKHSMRLIAETLATAIAVDFFLGDLGGLIEFFAGVTNTVAQNQFSQDLEWEADNYALKQLESLGREREDFARAMEKLASSSMEDSTLESLLSSHPGLKARIMNARGQTPEQ